MSAATLTRRDSLATAAILAVLLVAAVALVIRELTPEAGAPIDTRFESGSHVTFALIAPTRAADEEYADHVKSAKAAVREQVLGQGRLFTTVGVSDHWSVNEGIAILEAFGPFDEIVVGRNWFNSGVKRFITDLEGHPAVPQIVVLVEEIRVDTLPWQYGPPRVITRILGKQEAQQWASVAFALRIAP